jgi:hypothetical protein
MKKQKTTASDSSRLATSDLSRKSFVSQSALSNILRDIDKNGLPSTYSRSSIQRARADLVHHQTDYGPLVTRLEFELAGTNKKVGSVLQVDMLNPFAFLQYVCEHSARYSQLIIETYERQPCSPSAPWSIVLYQDGVDPGDGLVKEKSRHSVVFYWSFMEFGTMQLCHEELWATPLILRTAAAKQYGMTNVTHRVVEQFHSDMHDMLVIGVLVYPQGRQLRLFAKVDTLFGDLPALCEMIAAKGHSGNLCCPICQNASNHKSSGVPLHIRNKYCIPITSFDLEKFKLHSNNSLRDLCLRLQELKTSTEITSAKLADLETNVYGYSWTEKHIFINSRFRIAAADAIHFDWAHTYLQSGICDTEFGAFMKEMNKSRKNQHQCTYENLRVYVSKWTLPKGRGNVMYLFDKEHTDRFLRTGDFSCNSSEFLSLAPIISRFLQRVVKPNVIGMPQEKNVDCMIAVLEVVKLLQLCKVKDRVSPTTLAGAIVKHLDMFVEIYGEDLIRPKHHYALHLARQLFLIGFLFSTLTLERKHRAFKRYAQGRNNLEHFETGVIQEVLCHNMWELCEKYACAFTTSQPSRKQVWWLEEMFVGCSGFTIHNELYRIGYVHSGDVVACMHEDSVRYGELLISVGMVLPHGGSTLKSIVSLFDTESVDDGFIKCIVHENATALEARNILAAVTFSMSPDRTSCIVVNPN